ncbi:hypothetical protein [Aporhodopirellula aestuarii]|uniref:Uncharacterized protein n=1 Tax=Aporhodopirellula aestuarii TaxID=2950107 RepID=A0ABT0U8R1_9BACT|nr:hypothetical protein [Aporhodopirellula aestuarii]MCM2373261.1 hypothetical protein [Aporhodopirellula aestuarii]
MKVQVKNWIRSATALAVLTATCSPVHACGGGGGGYRGGGYGGSYGYASASPSYYGGSAYSSPVRYANPPQVHNPVSPAAPSRFQTASRSAPPVSFSNGNQSAAQFQRQSTAQTSFQSAPQQQQQRQSFSNSGNNPFNNQAASQTAVRSNPASAQPVRQSNTQPAVAQTQRPATPAPPANTEASALQMLASLSGGGAPTRQSASASSASIPEFGTVASATQASPTAPHIGTWTVSLPGDQSVSLILNEDNSFTWSATKGGSTKSFNGQYRLSENKLSLVRASDLQQMQGSWTASANGFIFKVDGDTTGALNFSRS